MDSTKPLQSRIALVTGVGRRAGIGAAICREIAKNGGDVFFTYWRPYDKETHSGNTENDPAVIAAELSQFGVWSLDIFRWTQKPGSRRSSGQWNRFASRAARSRAMI